MVGGQGKLKLTHTRIARIGLGILALGHAGCERGGVGPTLVKHDIVRGRRLDDGAQGIGREFAAEVVAVNAIHHLAIIVSLAIGQGQVKLEVATEGDHVLLANQVGIQLWLRARLLVSIDDVGPRHVAVARQILLRAVCVGVDIQVLEEVAHLANATHGEEVARCTVTHDALSLAGLGEVAITDFVSMGSTEEVTQLVGNGRIVGHGESIALAVGRGSTAQRSLARQSARRLGNHDAHVVCFVGEQDIEYLRTHAGIGDACAVNLKSRSVFGHNEAVVAQHLYLDAHIVAIVVIDDALGIVPEVVHLLLVQHASGHKLVQHNGRDEHGHAKLKHLARVVHHALAQTRSSGPHPARSLAASPESGIAHGVLTTQVVGATAVDMLSAHLTWRERGKEQKQKGIYSFHSHSLCVGQQR